MSRRVAVVILATICILNLNGLSYMWLGVSRQLSVLLGFCALYLIVIVGGNVRREVAYYAGAVLLFMSLSIMFALFFQPDLKLELLSGPLGSMVIVAATASALDRANKQEFEHHLDVIVLLSTLTSVAVLCSPFFYGALRYPPEDATRLAGFFANPNEAAMVCATGAAMALSRLGATGRHRFLFALPILTAGVVATLSKAGVLAFLGVFALALTGGSSSRRATAKAAGVLGALVFVIVAAGVSAELLSDRAIERAQQLGSLVVLRIDAETSTHRNVVWAAAMNQIVERGAVLGSGLGTMRSIVDGFFEAGQWRGAHNWWLMILGEAGLFALIPFVGLFGLLVRSGMALNRYRLVVLGYLLVLFVDTMASHNVFELRFHAFFIGVVIAATYQDMRATEGDMGTQAKAGHAN